MLSNRVPKSIHYTLNYIYNDCIGRQNCWHENKRKDRAMVEVKIKETE